MITYLTKDITTVERGIIAHGCNCRGVMGSGVALAIRNKWPIVYDRYHKLFEEYKNVRMKLLGYVQLVDLTNGDETLLVANVHTQLNYGRDNLVYADIDAVKHGLSRVISDAAGLSLPLYLPRIGCGLGGLDWDTQVGPILEQLNREDVEIYVCDL
jgi:O-acetyl-ADP-ribose deacetylase (regulator of RNase III)